MSFSFQLPQYELVDLILRPVAASLLCVWTSASGLNDQTSRDHFPLHRHGRRASHTAAAFDQPVMSLRCAERVCHHGRQVWLGRLVRPRACRPTEGGIGSGSRASVRELAIGQIQPSVRPEHVRSDNLVFDVPTFQQRRIRRVAMSIATPTPALTDRGTSGQFSTSAGRTDSLKSAVPVYSHPIQHDRERLPEAFLICHVLTKQWEFSSLAVSNSQTYIALTWDSLGTSTTVERGIRAESLLTVRELHATITLAIILHQLAAVSHSP